MPSIVVRLDGAVIKELHLSKLRTTLGRRVSNDVVLDGQAVSGEHADLQLSGHDVFIEDLDSTNGTLVNGQSVKEQQLVHGDKIQICRFIIDFIDETAEETFEHTMSQNFGPSKVSSGAAQTASGWARLKGLFRRDQKK